MSEAPVKFKATVEWAFLEKVCDMSGRYQVDLCNLSSEAVAALEKVGITPRQRADKPEKGWFIVAKSSIPIKAFDKQGNKINALVGNGSTAEALVRPYHWEWKNKKGTSPTLMKLTIVDLKEYSSDGGSDDSDDDIL